MNRNLKALRERTFDVVVVGGGIFGACIAWDATLRGLSVALIEKKDFGHATSANHFKVVHGGIRYLQHGDVYRIRESSRERSAFLRIAPHLVAPMPFLIPTYGHGLKGKEAMRVALAVYDALTFDRNRGIVDPSRQVPRSRILSRAAALEAVPDFNPAGLTGAAIFHDGQMYNPPRLTLAFAQSAARRGAVVANYTSMVRLLRRDRAVVGVAARDELTGDVFDIRGRVVVNATGPWAKWFLGQEPTQAQDLKLKREPTFSRDAYVIVKRRLPGPFALSVQGQTKDPDALLSRGNRHLFLVPWRNYTLVGVWHVVFEGRPEEFTMTAGEIQAFLDEINAAYPALSLALEDVTFWNAGLTLFGENEDGAVHLSYGKRSIVVDHQIDHAIEGLITVIGVRYTTGRGIAEKVGDLLLQKLGRPSVLSETETTPLHGGEFTHFDRLLSEAKQRYPTLPATVLQALLHNYGTAYDRVLGCAAEDPTLLGTIGDTTTLKAEVVYAIREEMAQSLADVVFRRTDLGTGENPGRDQLQACVELMQRELAWDNDRVGRELAEVWARFPGWLEQEAVSQILEVE